MRNFASNSKLWLLLLLLALLGIALHVSNTKVYEWVFVYYMSYDNDLSSCGKVILRDLERGLSNSNVAVVVQADFIDSSGMKRIGLYHADGRTHRKEILLRSEDSADEAELRKYLRWVRKRWIAKNYCIVFLNHGGRLNSMCKDNKPFKDSKKNGEFGTGKWLSASDVGEIVADFNQKTDRKVRLLFLQQCGRAAIQNLYSFTDTGEYVMASPLVVGAPNTYYTKTIASVARDPNITGEVLAETIMREDEHYTLYTLISNEELKKLPEKVAPVLKSFRRASTLSQPESCPHLFEHGGEKFYDLKSYFYALNLANENIAGKELEGFFEWCEDSLIVSKAVRDPNSTIESPYSGLSIYVPSSTDTDMDYSFLPLHQQTDLEDMMKLISK
ncbi:MAG: clostripain-related cysteine peptidase [Planctomycetota bacterium]|jgi:hypothetical protein